MRRYLTIAAPVEQRAALTTFSQRLFEGQIYGFQNEAQTNKSGK